jgi:hypothetical protein
MMIAECGMRIADCPEAFGFRAVWKVARASWSTALLRRFPAHQSDPSNSNFIESLLSLNPQSAIPNPQSNRRLP